MSCQTSEQLLRVLHLVGHTRGNTIFSGQLKMNAIVILVEQKVELIISLKISKEIKQRMIDKEAKGAKRTWRTGRQTIKCYQVFYLQLASLSLLLNDFLAIQWTFGSWIFSIQQSGGQIIMTLYSIKLIYTRILLSRQEKTAKCCSPEN